MLHGLVIQPVTVDALSLWNKGICHGCRLVIFPVEAADGGVAVAEDGLEETPDAVFCWDKLELAELISGGLGMLTEMTHDVAVLRLFFPSFVLTCHWLYCTVRVTSVPLPCFPPRGFQRLLVTKSGFRSVGINGPRE